MMEKGQKVYTVNHITNEIDSWEYVGLMANFNEPYAHLRNGRRDIVLPVRCVFATEDEAIAVARLSN